MSPEMKTELIRKSIRNFLYSRAKENRKDEKQNCSKFKMRAYQIKLCILLREILTTF